MMDQSTIVVIPTYNERNNLPRLVRAIVAMPGFSVMVVDDASPDGTGDIADRLAGESDGRVHVVHRTGPRGFGRSYVDGFTRALAGSWAVICQMDADFSHDPRYLPDLIGAVGEYDVVIGSRYLHGISVVNWPLHRLILSTFANRYIRAITRLRVTDCTGGFRCWRRDALERLPLERIVSEGYAFQVEMLYEAQRAGCRIGEVPIIFIERREGQSKLSKGVIVESVLMPWRLLLRRRRPASASGLPCK
jgi:dolichol-phosphate mannosyltransferase